MTVVETAEEHVKVDAQAVVADATDAAATVMDAEVHVMVVALEDATLDVVVDVVLVAMDMIRMVLGVIKNRKDYILWHVVEVVRDHVSMDAMGAIILVRAAVLDLVVVDVVIRVIPGAVERVRQIVQTTV